ncbi:MAG: porin family protein [Alphaproteobacteria bacterium]|nr:porin family protein [Alphaproteobacteria bacterium]
MNIKTLLLAGAACSVAFSASAADVRPYVGLKLGAAMENADIKNAKNVDQTKMFGSVAGGLAFALPKGDIRTELEYTYRDEFSGHAADDLKVKFQSQALFVNVYYDLPVTWAVQPYVNAGLGYSRIEGKLNGLKKKKNKIGWNLGVGAAYNLTQSLAMDVGYRYVNLGKYNYEGNKADLYNHEFYAGIRYSF